MIDFFNRIYSCGFNSNKFLNLLKINSCIRFSTRLLANLILPRYLLLVKKGNGLYMGKRNKQIIVSLTSFPLRIHKLWLVIETLLRQTVKPDKLILYLSKVQFPNEMDDLPVSLTSLCSRGLEIVFVEDDFRSHKKYYYAMQSYPDSIVITVDDDIYYPTSMLQNLLDCHNKYPHSVICRYAKRIIWDVTSDYIMPSKKWKRIYSPQLLSGSDIFLGTGGGTLFPVFDKPFYDDVFNIKLAIQLCPLEDDLWINTMLRLKKSNIVVIKDYKSILPVLNKNDLTLYSVNISETVGTDEQLREVILYYATKGLYPYSLSKIQHKV